VWPLTQSQKLSYFSFLWITGICYFTESDTWRWCDNETTLAHIITGSTPTLTRSQSISRVGFAKTRYSITNGFVERSMLFSPLQRAWKSLFFCSHWRWSDHGNMPSRNSSKPSSLFPELLEELPFRSFFFLLSFSASSSEVSSLSSRSLFLLSLSFNSISFSPESSFSFSFSFSLCLL